MRESARLAWCVSSRGAAVALQAGWWSATRSQWKSSTVTSLVVARRTVGGIGAVSVVAHCRGSSHSLKVVTGIPISARYHVPRSSGVGSMYASCSATVVTARPAWRPYSLISLVPVAELLSRHRCLVAHQLHHARISAQSPSRAVIQPHIHAILGTARLALCQ